MHGNSRTLEANSTKEECASAVLHKYLSPAIRLGYNLSTEYANPVRAIPDPPTYEIGQVATEIGTDDLLIGVGHVATEVETDDLLVGATVAEEGLLARVVKLRIRAYPGKLKKNEKFLKIENKDRNFLKIS